MGKYDKYLNGLPAKGPTNSGKYSKYLAGIEKSTAAKMMDVAERSLQTALGTVNPKTSYAAAVATANPEAQLKLATLAPGAGSVVGSAVAPGIGTAAGGGAGEILRQAIEREYGQGRLPSSEAFPVDWESGAKAAGATVLAGVPELDSLKAALSSVAQSQGRRALGYTKRFFSKSPEQLPRANEVAQEMLDQGIIRPFSGSEATINRAIVTGRKAGKEIGKTIEDLQRTGVPAFEADEVAREASRQLTPPYKGGAYDKTKKIVKEISDTIKAHGTPVPENPTAPFATNPAGSPKSPVSFKSSQALKKKLANIGKFIPNTNDERQQLFQRATGIVRKAQDDAVESLADPQTVSQFKKAKDVYGKTEEALGALTNRLSSEAGNRQFGLLDTILAAGAGNPTSAIGQIVGRKVLERIGAPTLSAMANSLAKSGMSRQAANSVFQTILAKIEESDGR